MPPGPGGGFLRHDSRHRPRGLRRPSRGLRPRHPPRQLRGPPSAGWLFAPAGAPAQGGCAVPGPLDRRSLPTRFQARRFRSATGSRDRRRSGWGGDTHVRGGNKCDAAPDGAASQHEPKLLRPRRAGARSYRRAGLCEPVLLERRRHRQIILVRRARARSSKRIHRWGKPEERSYRWRERHSRWDVRSGREPREPVPSRRHPGVSRHRTELQGGIPAIIRRDHCCHHEVWGERVVGGRLFRLSEQGPRGAGFHQPRAEFC